MKLGVWRYRKTIWVMAAVAVLTLVACTPPGNDYSEYRTLPDEGWLYGDTLEFTPEFVAETASGRLITAVTHDSKFRYSTLWLEVVTADSAGRVTRDTVSFPLADGFGRWQGNGLGGYLQMADTIGHPLTLVSGRPVKIRHIMRTDTLRSLRKVGIFFVPD